ncbi:uncharacterized protein LOC143199909 [Rhynchophorus ferrugineus]|uniref:uncharacterized protein LOC143199909 n=1 Tax=Rhynchophorus ferrugineus TaxID=354439 RepID=UPI003FCC9FCF
MKLIKLRTVTIVFISIRQAPKRLQKETTLKEDSLEGRGQCQSSGKSDVAYAYQCYVEEKCPLILNYFLKNLEIRSLKEYRNVSISVSQSYDSQHRPTETFNMFKLVVLSALIAIAVAHPPAYYYEAAPVAVKSVVVPAAVSSTYRQDVVSKPATVTYSAPAVVAAPVAKAVVAEPVAVAAPVVAKTVVAPAAVSSTYRSDVVRKPATVTYAAAPVVAKAVVATPVVAAPAAYAYSAPAAYAYPAPAAYSYSAPVAHAYSAPSVHAW